MSPLLIGFISGLVTFLLFLFGWSIVAAGRLADNFEELYEERERANMLEKANEELQAEKEKLFIQNDALKARMVRLRTGQEEENEKENN